MLTLAKEISKHMKHLLSILLVSFLFVLPTMAQDDGDGKEERTGPSQLEIAATGVAEIYKKELKLTKEQYPKVKQIYTKFLYHQGYYPERKEIGRDQLYKRMQKVLDEEQFEKWKTIEVNQPLSEKEKAELKKQYKGKSPVSKDKKE